MTYVQSIEFVGRLGPFHVNLTTEAGRWFCQPPGQDHVLCRDEADARALFARSCAALTDSGCSPHPRHYL